MKTIFELHELMLREGKERARKAKAEKKLPAIRVAAGYETPREFPVAKHVPSKS